MKPIAMAIGCLVIGLLGGYYIGFDHGFEQAVLVNDPSITRLQEGMAAVIGTWQSTRDQKSMREFKNDGLLVDAYNGSEVQKEGTRWMLFSKDIPDPEFKGELDPDMFYLAIASPGESPMYFKVTELTADSLKMIYLDRGGGLSYARIQ